MQELLYLAHRIPYPPNKGDKIRSYHLLRHLSQRYRVHLGTFIDDETDWQYTDKVKALCGETCFLGLRPQAARLRSLRGLLTGSALSLPYYRDKRLQEWVDMLLRTRPVKRILVYSSPMAQYARKAQTARRVIDFVDVDSDKWRQYAAAKPWPLSWIYRREARLLLDVETRIAREFDSASFVSEAEAALFRKLVPQAAANVSCFNNGVDTDYFSPKLAHANPYPGAAAALVFTGAMDYWANVDAVDWFARAIFPAVRAELPEVRFYIVGARPTSAVQALAALPGVVVTGSVPDVRPYLAHAALAVAPLRIARGTQNKVLEAMAMEKTVVVSRQAMEGICARPGQEVLVAEDAQEFSRLVTAALKTGANTLGSAARAYVLREHSWETNLAVLDALLFPPPVSGAGTRAGSKAVRERAA